MKVVLRVGVVVGRMDEIMLEFDIVEKFSGGNANGSISLIEEIGNEVWVGSVGSNTGYCETVVVTTAVVVESVTVAVSQIVDCGSSHEESVTITITSLDQDAMRRSIVPFITLKLIVVVSEADRPSASQKLPVEKVDESGAFPSPKVFPPSYEHW